MSQLTPTQTLLPLFNNEHWSSFEEVIRNLRDQKMNLLKRCSKEDLERLQGSVQELDYLLALKSNALAEGNAQRQSSPA